jgi:hypothetical protein
VHHLIPHNARADFMGSMLSFYTFCEPCTSAEQAMEIATFEDLLSAARQQDEPQRLLFVFTAAELDPDSTEAQRRDFAAGRGGALVPIMTADKSTDALTDFASLAQESQQFDKPWAVVFVAALSGRGGVAPSDADVEQVLTRMTDAVRAGELAGFIPFDREGHTVVFE